MLKGGGCMIRRRETGLETVEYAIIAGMVIAGIVAIVVAVGAWVKHNFQTPLQTDPQTQESNE